MGHLAAHAAADATVDDIRHGVLSERVRVILDSERRAPGQPDAGMIAGAGVFINTEALPHVAFLLFKQVPYLRFDSPLAVKLAFSLRHDEFGAFRPGSHGLPQGMQGFLDVIGMDFPDPPHAGALERIDDGHPVLAPFRIGLG